MAKERRAESSRSQDDNGIIFFEGLPREKKAGTTVHNPREEARSNARASVSQPAASRSASKVSSPPVRRRYDESDIDKAIDATLDDISRKLRKVITDTPEVESIKDLNHKQLGLYKQVLINKIRAERQLIAAQSYQTKRGFSGKGLKKSLLGAGSRVLISPKNSNRLLGLVQRYPVAGAFIGKFVAKKILQRTVKRRHRGSSLKSMAMLGLAGYLFSKFKSR